MPKFTVWTFKSVIVTEGTEAGPPLTLPVSVIVAGSGPLIDKSLSPVLSELSRVRQVFTLIYCFLIRKP